MRSDRDDKRGGGVAIYIKSGIAHFSLMEYIPDGPRREIEQIWVKVTVNKRSFTIGVVYKPPNVTYHSLTPLDDNLSILYPMSDKLICMGDININFLNRNSTECKYVTDILDNDNLRQIMEHENKNK